MTTLTNRISSGARRVAVRLRDLLWKGSAQTAGRRMPGPLRIAAAATGQFPVMSHTFVYQELLSYHEHLGAEVRLYHQSDHDRTELHQAFRYLDENRKLLISADSKRRADFAHWQARAPHLVDSILQGLVEHSGLTRDQVENDQQVLYGFTLARELEQYGVDFIHTYFFYEQALAGLIASQLLGVPRAVSAYADHVLKDHPLKVLPLHLATASVVVATSRRIKEELLSLVEDPDVVADKILVKPNGVDGRRFPFVERVPARERTLRFVSVSRIEPKKGLIEMVEAIRQVVSNGADIRVDVVGAPDAGNDVGAEYAARFEAAIRAGGLEDRIVLLGRQTQEEIRTHLNAADVFLAPYVETSSGDKDGIPTAILEAIATGLPVLASDAGSITEIIDSGVEGWIVEQANPEALAKQIAALDADREVLPAAGRNARLRFEREFDSRITDAKLHDRLTEILADRVPGLGAQA